MFLPHPCIFSAHSLMTVRRQTLTFLGSITIPFAIKNKITITKKIRCWVDYALGIIQFTKTLKILWKIIV